jgi:hypothetical protein
MPDITMCTSKLCPQRKECYRSTAIPSDWQSWSNFYDKDEHECEQFWEENENEQ